MTRREMLEEQYEDALFALLMDEVAEVEGKKVLEENRRLRDSGEVVIPEETHRRCLRTIARKTAQRDAKQFGRTVSKVVSKVAVAALVGMLTFTTVFAASEDFRTRTLNFIMEIFDDRTEFSLPPEQLDSTGQTQEVPQFSVGWLPEGFALADEGESTSLVWKAYKNDDTGASISVSEKDLTGGGVGIDTEDAQTQPVQLHGRDALLVEKDGVIQIAWQHSEESPWLFSVVGQDVDSDTLREIAESVTIE